MLQAFKSADKKRTGTIPIKSLKDILETIQKSPLTNQQFYLITADADVESSGQLEFGEYMTVRSGRCVNLLPFAPPQAHVCRESVLYGALHLLRTLQYLALRYDASVLVLSYAQT